MHNVCYRVGLWGLALLLFSTTFAQAQKKKYKVDKYTFGSIKVRQIGPAVTSGRVAALDAVRENPEVLYVGTAGGGVWKSENSGISFKPIFEDFCQSIGAVHIVQNTPDTVWVGTGEPWTRNSVSVGCGVFKTTTGGDSWKKMGLDSTERIARIRTSPKDPNTVYVAALGALWSDSEHRGLYKSTDGGKNWKKVLYLSPQTGCADFDINPENPEEILAAMWDFRREPHSFRSGGKNSGLYKSKDGGKTWNKVKDGLPKDELGRIAVNYSRVAPSLVYALVEADSSGLFRSTDFGESFERVNSAYMMGERPFYFSNILADPLDTAKVYKPSFTTHASKDSGKTFEAITFPLSVHADHHALWVGGEDSKLMYLGTDGGVYVSRNGGKNWLMCRDLPVAQFYRLEVDNEVPYNVYGGLQDNGSWRAPTQSPGGITNADWENVGMGDGFYAFPHKSKKDVVFWMYQGGQIRRSHTDTKEVKDIRPFAIKDMEKLRFNWNSPMVFSPNSDALYLGSQYLLKSWDDGDTWVRLSPDLTTDDPKKQQQEASGGLTIDNSTAENHCSLYAIAESPRDSSIVWTGSDDGLLHVTADGGKSWKNVTENLPNIPKNTWVSYVFPSSHDAKTCFVTLDGHRHGDMTPYVLKTTDLGQTWERLNTEKVKGHCHSVLQDTENPDLLFLGTEMGLYISLTGGKSWARFTGNLPQVSVRDMRLHPRENDLILATHGLGICILDDITPLRSLKEQQLSEDVVMLPSRPFVVRSLGSIQNFPSEDEFIGPNTPEAAVITYYLRKRHIFGDMFVEIYDERDSLVKKLPASPSRGINRVVWALRKPAPKVPKAPTLAAAALNGPLYPAGTYTVKLTKNEKVYEGKIHIQYAQDSPHSEADRKLRDERLMDAYTLLEDLAFLDHRVMQMHDYVEKAEKEPKLSKGIKKKLKNFREEAETLHKTLVATKVGRITGEQRLREKIAEVYGAILGYQGKPTASTLEALSVYEAEFKAAQEKYKSLAAQFPKIQKFIEKTGSAKLKLSTREDFFKD